MPKLKETDRIKGLFSTLSVYRDTTKDSDFYVGPTQFLKSALFRDCQEFRTQFWVVKMISNTIFTAGHVYQLVPDNEMPPYFFEFSFEDSLFKEVVAAGERGVNWEYEKLRNVTEVISYQHVASNCLDEDLRSLSTCFLIKYVEMLMFGQPKEVYLLEVRTRLGINDTAYNVCYHNLPPGIVHHILAK